MPITRDGDGKFSSGGGGGKSGSGKSEWWRRDSQAEPSKPIERAKGPTIDDNLSEWVKQERLKQLPARRNEQ